MLDSRGFFRRLAYLGLLACTGCGSTMPFTIPEYKLAQSPPGKSPATASVAPQLASYPGLEVAYVANADGDVYHYRGVFYSYFDGSWFCAQALRGPWSFIEMKYVPSDLFRVRGHRPPSLR